MKVSPTHHVTKNGTFKKNPPSKPKDNRGWHKTYEGEDDHPVKCNWCEWYGSSEDLEVNDTGKERCPNCKEIGHIEDIGEEDE